MVGAVEDLVGEVVSTTSRVSDGDGLCMQLFKARVRERVIRNRWVVILIILLDWTGYLWIKYQSLRQF